MIFFVLKMWYTWVYQVLKGAIFSQIKVKHQNYGLIFIHVLWMFNIFEWLMNPDVSVSSAHVYLLCWPVVVISFGGKLVLFI